MAGFINSSTPSLRPATSGTLSRAPTSHAPPRGPLRGAGSLPGSSPAPLRGFGMQPKVLRQRSSCSHLLPRRGALSRDTGNIWESRLTTGLGPCHGNLPRGGTGLGAGRPVGRCGATEGAQVAAPAPEEEGVEAADYLGALAAEERQRRDRGLPLIPGRLPDFIAPTHVLSGGELHAHMAVPAEPLADQAGQEAGKALREEDLWSDIEAEEGGLEERRGPSVKGSDEGEQWGGESAGRYKCRADALDSVARSCVGR